MNGGTIRTFLGANSGDGFVSLYDRFQEEGRMIIIKGGPGSGKSSLMKKAAAEALKKGHFVEYCYCSSDANSLDAIRIPELGISLADGTSPHLIEPRFPGAVDDIFYTGAFWNRKKLTENRDEIEFLSRKIKECFSHAYRYLSAAKSGAEDLAHSAAHRTERGKLQNFANKITGRNLAKRKEKSRFYPRFLTGITPQGILTNKDTVYTMADKVFVLRDPFCISDLFINEVLKAAEEYGATAYVFYDPIRASIPVHVVFPEDGVAFVTENTLHDFVPSNGYRIHLSRFILQDEELKDLRRKSENLLRICLREAVQSLAKEKKLHDDLEEFYIEAMDYKKMNASAEKLIKSLF